MQYSQRFIGITVLVLSALVFSSAGLFSKGISAPAWDIIFWRGIFAAILTSLFIAFRGHWTREFTNMGKTGWLVAVLGASGTAAFIPAFKYTSIANVSLIYAVTPLLTALLAWWFLSERMTRAALVGSILAFVGVVVIVGGSLGSINLTGDLLALWMALAIALLMVVYRFAPQTPAAGPSVLSCLVLLPPAYIWGNPFDNTVYDISLMAAFGVVFAFASVTMAEGVKRLPAGESALLSTLEAPFAPVLAWLVLSEIPPFATFIGGGIILIAVVGSQVFNNAASSKKAPSVARS